MLPENRKHEPLVVGREMKKLSHATIPPNRSGN
jgi:hypothetical protein